MHRLAPPAAAAAAALLAVPASAALKEGDRVPSLVTQGALAGKPFAFNLQQELRKGPVVLYFFPKAFTPGCSLEAKAFAERIGDFKKAGAQVFGMSGDTLEELEQFSVKDCAGAFAVARATPSTIEAFYQEFGRAGRDGLDARCILLHQAEDWKLHNFFQSGRYPSGEDLVNAHHALKRFGGEPPTFEELTAVSPLPRTKLKTAMNFFRGRGIVKEDLAGKLHLIRDDMDLDDLTRPLGISGLRSLPWLLAGAGAAGIATALASLPRRRKETR